MEIHLQPETAQFVHDQVSSGHYTGISEVIEDALNMLQNSKLTEAQRKAKFERLRADIQKGIDQLNRGELSDLTLEEIKAEARRRFNQNQKA